MILSRPLESERIVEFTPESRFIKLPMENVLEVMGLEPIAPQIALINALNDPKYRHVSACLSRRTGKTTVANAIAFALCMVPGTHVLVVAPNYNLSAVSWDMQTSILKQFNIELDRDNLKDKIKMWANGSTYRIGSVGQVDSVLGRSYDFIIFDEAAIDPKGGSAFNVQLRPTLDKLNSKVLFISTPRGDNYFKEFYERGFKEEYPEWISIHATWKDNPRAKEEDIAAARRDMSRAEFEQEYEASFSVFEGQIYECYSEDEHFIDCSDVINDILAGSKDYELIMGIDVGYKDPTAAVVIATHFETGISYIVDSYVDAQISTPVIGAEIKRLVDKWNIDIVYVDSAAAQFREDLVYMFDISNWPAFKSVDDGIAYVYGCIASGKLFVHNELKGINLMFKNYRWDPRPGLLKPRPLHDKVHCHPADAVRYALYSYNRQV